MAATITRAEIAEIFNDSGYVLGVVSAASFFASIHPEAAEYLGLTAVVLLALANRVNPPAAAAPAAPTQ
jgi:hypothetical protein